MSVNLVDLVLKQVGGNIPGILGSLLGESADRTQGAIAGAVPAILGGLMGAASKGGGIAEQLASAIGQQDDGILDDLAGAFGSNHRTIAEQGSSMLSSLLGDGVIGALVGAIGKFSGLGGGSTKSLLGMIGPIVLAVLSREQKSQGLDGSGMVNLLMSQKDSIQNAMPSGLASALGGAGFLDDLMGTAQSATASISEAVDTAAGKVGEAAGQAAAAVGGTVDSTDSTARQTAAATSDANAAAVGAAQSGGSWLRWLLPLVILLALLWLAFQFLGGADVEEAAENAGNAVSSAVEATTEAAGDAVDAATEAASDAATAASDAADDAADATTEAASEAATAASDAASDAADAASEAAASASDTVTAMVGDVDVGGRLSSAFDSLAETLSGITDTASAEAAIPTLEELSSGLGELTDLADQLPEEASSSLSDMVSSGLDSLDGLVADLESIPGVGDLIKPIIDQIREQLAAFTAA